MLLYIGTRSEMTFICTTMENILVLLLNVEDTTRLKQNLLLYGDDHTFYKKSLLNQMSS